MKKFFKLLIVLLLIVVSGCTTNSSHKPDTTYTIPLEQTTDENYHWNYTITDSSIISVKEEKANDEMSYLGNNCDFVVEGLKEGEASIYFEYIKDGNEEALYYYTVTLKVNDNLELE